MLIFSLPLSLSLSLLPLSSPSVSLPLSLSLSLLPRYVKACAPIWVSTGAYNSSISPDGNYPASSNVLPQGRCYVTNQQLRGVTFLDPCNLLGEQSVTVDKGYCTSGTDVDMLEVGVVMGAWFCRSGCGQDIGVIICFLSPSPSLPLQPGRFIVGSPGYKRGIGEYKTLLTLGTHA